MDMNPEPQTATEGGSPVQPARHQTGLITMLFTDLVGSTALKEEVGDRTGASLTQQHHGLVRELLQGFKGGEEIGTAGDSFLIVFARPSDAVHFGLLLQARLRAMNQGSAARLEDRIGIHVGEVVIWAQDGSPNPKGLTGVQVDICARVMGLAQGGQILLTRSAFDNARQMLKGEDIQGVGPLEWLNHGSYLLKGIQAPVEVCEVGEVGMAPLQAPAGSEKAQRQVTPESEPVLGWRPAVGQWVPNTRWRLETKLGEGGFGEVWLGRNPTTKERRVFKFCFQVERVRFLKRELTLFRLLKERIGEHPNIVRLQDVYLDQPPFYVEMDYVEGADLRSWAQEHGGAEAIPLATRLEIVAQAADGLQAAHEAGIIHRDIKPANILIGGKGIEPTEVRVKLTDFGIGQVVSEEYLSGITRAGFTQTMMSDSSSSHTGTQLYMAPELSAGKPASTRSDIYSLGVVLYQLLAGDFSRPVATDWANEISDPLLRDDLKHCFAGNPQDRFAGAGQLAKHLRAWPERRAALVREQAELAARERAAYRRGIARTAAAASVIVVLLSGLVLSALNQAHRAKEAARDLRRHVYAADMNVAHEALEDNNLWLGANLVRKHFPKPGEEDLRGFEWRYLWQRCQSDDFFTFSEHSNIVTCAVFSPDGRVLATAGFDKTVKILDLGSHKVLATLEGFANAQDVIGRNSLAFSPDGRLLAVADGQNITLWDTAGWQQPRQKLECRSLDDDWNSSLPVTFSPDGKTLAAKEGSNSLRFWDTTSWQVKTMLAGKLRFSAGGLAYSTDGKTLAISAEQQIELWDLQSESQIVGSPILFPYTGCLKFSARGNVLAAGNYEGEVMLWDLHAARVIKRWRPNKTLALGMDLSPDGTILATGGGDQLIHLWNAGTQKKLATLQGHVNEIWALAFSPDGRTLASASKDGAAKLWNTTFKSGEIELANSYEPLWFSPDGRTLITFDSDLELQVWDVVRREVIRRIKVPVKNAPKPELWGAYPISPDGRKMAFRLPNGTVEIWNLESLQRTATVPTDEYTIHGLAFSADSRLLAARGLGSATAVVWDIVRGQEVARFTNTYRALAFSPDGAILAGSSPDYAVKLWNISTKQELATLRGHKWAITQTAFSPDGKLLVSGAIDNTARIWDVAAKREVAVLQGHKSGIHSLAFSPDGRTIATGSTDETVKLWSAATGQQLMTLREFKADLGSLLFCSDGTTLAAGRASFITRQRTVQLWRAPSFPEIEAAERARPDGK